MDLPALGQGTALDLTFFGNFFSVFFFSISKESAVLIYSRNECLRSSVDFTAQSQHLIKM